MLAIASAAGDALPCLFLQANNSEAAPQLVGRAAGWRAGCGWVCV
jgi:hypothetical protein